MRISKTSMSGMVAALLLLCTPALAQVVRQPQVPLAANKIPQFVQQLPLLSLDTSGIKVALGTAVDVSMCEFQTSILPPGSLGKKNPLAPLTYIWGYQNSASCAPAGAPIPGSYLGPVVVATRGIPTQMTYNNALPDAEMSRVQAYTTSTDQTLQWADPFSLQALGPYPPPAFNNPFPGIPYALGVPEENTCNDAAKLLIPGGFMPAPCVDHYGFYGIGLNPPVYTAPIPAAPHLHGGEIPAMLDGGPDAWFTPNGIYGHGYYSKNGTADALAGKAIYTYPNGQEPAPIWFHDHVLGATRLNVYAGIAGAYMITDDPFANTGALPAGLLPLGLDRNGNGTLDLLPSPTPGGAPLISDEVLIPVVIQDRMFDTTGQLFIPAVGLNPEHPFWVPEFVGDVIVVNGKAWPTTTVEPKRYRFLFLNGSNARAYELFLLNRLTNMKGPSMWVIGNDQGYLDKPALIDPNVKPNDKLVIMPGERYEVVIDFGASAGATLELRNTARTPYPGGAPVSGNTTGRIMQFVVSATCPSGQCGPGDTSYNPAAVAPANTIRVGEGKLINRLADPLTGTVNPAVTVNKTRQLTLNEVIGPGGPLEILMNNTTYKGDPTARRNAGFKDFQQIVTQWDQTSFYSEFPAEGETEIWEIVNITADAHPIHPHLVGFQILNREPFNFGGFDAAYNATFPGGLYLPGFGPPCDYNLGCTPDVPARAIGGNPDVTPFLSGVILPPNPQEQGWKDTAISYPGEVLRIIVRFAPTTLPNTTEAVDAHYDFNPAEGHGYVWHCHIIDHEDNEMMRPFAVIANPAVCDPAITDSMLPGFCLPGEPMIQRTFIKGVNY